MYSQISDAEELSLFNDKTRLFSVVKYIYADFNDNDNKTLYRMSPQKEAECSIFVINGVIRKYI